MTYDGFTEYPAGRIDLKRINGGTNRYDNVVVSGGQPNAVPSLSTSGLLCLILLDTLIGGHVATRRRA